MILQQYTSWLKENQLDELAHKELEIASKMDMPLMKLLAHMPEGELIKHTKQRLALLLDSFSKGKELELMQQNMRDWEAGKLLFNIPKDAIQSADIFLAGYVGRMALSAFVPQFTADSSDAVAITNGL